MKTEDIVELGKNAANILNDLSKAADHIDRIIKIVKNEPDAWKAVRKHFLESSNNLDKLLELRGLLNEEK